MEQSPKGDRKGTKGATKGTKGKRDPSTGRFQPRHGTYMVETNSQVQETTTPGQLWEQEGLLDPATLPTVPDDAPHVDYVFVSGHHETVTFAWPTSAGTAIASQMVNEPEAVPHVWQIHYPGPAVKCNNCHHEDMAKIMTRYQSTQPRSIDAAWVTEPGWYWSCPSCATKDTLPLTLLTTFVDSKEWQNIRTHAAFPDNLGDDVDSVMYTDPGASASQVGEHGAAPASGLSTWENFNQNDLLPGHTLDTVYELFQKASTTGFSDDEADDLDHYLGIPGIDQWVIQVKRQKELEEQKLRQERENALEQRRKTTELNKKVKADRLAAIRAQLGKEEPLTPDTAKFQKGSPSRVTFADLPPTSTQSAPPILQRDTSGTNSYVPNVSALEKCPTHNLPLTQVRDRTTGKDKFLCPRFMECNYEHDPLASYRKDINPDAVLRDPKTGCAQCSCGYVTRQFKSRKAGHSYNRVFWRCPAARGKQCDFFMWDDGKEHARIGLHKDTYTPKGAATSTSFTVPPGTAQVTSELLPCVECRKGTSVKCGTCQLQVCSACSVFRHECPASKPPPRHYPTATTSVPWPSQDTQGTPWLSTASPLETQLQEVAMEAARLVTNRTIQKLPGVFEQTSHGANRVRPPNKREQFMAAAKRDSRYSGYTPQQLEEIWKDYKELAEQERVMNVRGELGVGAPTIDLNTCAIDALERVPKLTLPIRQAIILKRNSLPGKRFSSWTDLSNIPGLGVVMLQSMKVFCRDPAECPPNPHHVLAVNTQDIQGDVNRHHMSPDLDRLLTLWTKANEYKPGKMYQDSGCNRCVAGHDVHEAWQAYLAEKGLRPVKISKQEEFIFGNGKVEMSDCAFQYPAYLDGKLVGSLDIARIPVSCPALFSKRMMREWEHVLDFKRQVTTVGAFNLQYPFEDTVPVLDVFQLPHKLSNNNVPPCFRQPQRNDVHVVTKTVTSDTTTTMDSATTTEMTEE